MHVYFLERVSMDAKQFGAKLKELREAKGLTQKQLSDAAAVSIRQLSRLEIGTSVATWPMVVKLSEALGVDCRAFLEEPQATTQPPKRGRPPTMGTKPTKGKP